MADNVLRGRNELPTCRVDGVILKQGTVFVQLAAAPNICNYCINIAFVSIYFHTTEFDMSVDGVPI